MPSDPIHSTLHTRASLLFRLRNWDDTDSWEEFYRIYRKLVYGYGRKCGLTHEEAEEVTQDVFTRVSVTIKDFESSSAKSSFRGYLMTLARWRVTDKFRIRPKVRQMLESFEPGTHPQGAEHIPSPDQQRELWDKEWRDRLLEAAMERISRRTRAKHFQIFDLHVRQQWPVSRISQEMDVNAATVYLVTHRLMKQLKTEVEKLKTTLD